MSINNAVQLIFAVDASEGLREKLNQCKGNAEFSNCLKTLGYKFTSEEFEDAVRMLHLRCQEQEDAELILEKALWLRFLLEINEY